MLECNDGISGVTETLGFLKGSVRLESHLNFPFKQYKNVSLVTSEKVLQGHKSLGALSSCSNPNPRPLFASNNINNILRVNPKQRRAMTNTSAFVLFNVSVFSSVFKFCNYK